MIPVECVLHVCFMCASCVRHVCTLYALAGIFIEIAIHDVYLNEPILHDHDTLVGISCGCILLCFNLMRVTHKGGIRTRATGIFLILFTTCPVVYVYVSVSVPLLHANV